MRGGGESAARRVKGGQRPAQRTLDAARSASTLGLAGGRLFQRPAPNEAVAFVEATDPKRGILTNGAMLTLHRGERTLWLTSPALPARDRAAALKTFEVLGRIAAKRLD